MNPVGAAQAAFVESPATGVSAPLSKQVSPAQVVLSADSLHPKAAAVKTVQVFVAIP